jgi:hypothetical protein
MTRSRCVTGRCGAPRPAFRNYMGMIAADTTTDYPVSIRPESVSQHEHELNMNSTEHVARCDNMETTGLYDACVRGGIVTFSFEA